MLFLDELSQNREKAEKFVPQLKRLGISVVGLGMLIALSERGKNLPMGVYNTRGIF
jgi:hypothetical protein